MKWIARIPHPIRPLIKRFGNFTASAIPATKSGLSNHVRGFSKALSPSESLTGLKLHMFARQLPSYYRDKILTERINAPYIAYESIFEDNSNGLERAMALDYSTYLKDDILVKVDRASMSVGLEGREPLVDHRLLEFAARLPFDYKFDGKVSKKILKDVVHRYVPESIMQRPKAGFSVPIYSWLRGELSGLLDEFCSPNALDETGFLNEKLLTSQITLFKRGRLHYSPLIWRLLMLQSWHQRWMQ